MYHFPLRPVSHITNVDAVNEGNLFLVACELPHPQADKQVLSRRSPRVCILLTLSVGIKSQLQLVGDKAARG